MSENETDKELSENRQNTQRSTERHPIEDATKTELESALEQQSPERNVLLRVASPLLTETGVTMDMLDLDDESLTERLQAEFQTNIREHYRTSGLADRIKALALSESVAGSTIPLDEQANNLIAEASQGTHGWVDMLPNLRKQNVSAGLNCTMGSAMLHLALEQLGIPNVRTVLRDGHHVVARELEDGSLKLYDPTSLSTHDERLVGYTRIFNPSEFKRGHNVTGKGFAFELISDKEDRIGGITEATNGGRVRQSFFAYDPEVKMDVAIALGNLSEIKDDATKVEGEGTIPFDLDAYKGTLVEFVRANNTTELGDAELIELAQSNRQPLEELLRDAATYYDQGGTIPNPFDYLSSPLLQPKTELTPLPDPKAFKGSSERYEQAKELCERYPALKELDFGTLKKTLNLFDAHDYLTT